jgi:hypothetical protein
LTMVTFDTLKLVDKLKAAGIPQEQDELVTKTILDLKLSPILTDLAVLKWMMGVLLAGVLSLVLKAFF